MTESQATTNLLAKLKEHGHFWKASDRFRAGIPDIIGCYLGRFIAIEMKIDKNLPTLLQDHTMRDIVKNTGYAAVVRYSNRDHAWFLSGMGQDRYDMKDLIKKLTNRMRFHESDI